MSAKPGNQLAVKHGASSETWVRTVATAQKRRLLRQIGLVQAVLDGLGLALLDNWARAQGKVELLDSYFAQSGLLDADGEPRGATKLNFTALNSPRLALSRLGDYLKARSDVDPSIDEVGGQIPVGATPRSSQATPAGPTTAARVAQLKPATKANKNLERARTADSL